ncbi:RNA-binding protein MEX3D [Platysternon megacephalum]|uniref:RNA-binding protein MEX3D n=1 Tax=Platysternon megacephalum TaxID=55544 RepID=A0A4D9DZ02_9SAUR|nr:RNA-binding protein MEX3D [Platysternon megacephalum]
MPMCYKDTGVWAQACQPHHQYQGPKGDQEMLIGNFICCVRNLVPSKRCVTIFDLSQETEKEEAKTMTVENLFQHSSVHSNLPAKYFKLDAHILYVNMAENAAQTVGKQVLSLPGSIDLVSTGVDRS